MDLIVRGDERRKPRGIKELTALSPIRLDILECDSGIGLVDGIEGPLVTNVLLRYEGDSTP
jgi:hypothetical protein